jgi:hypothetical protein
MQTTPMMSCIQRYPLDGAWLDGTAALATIVSLPMRAFLVRPMGITRVPKFWYNIFQDASVDFAAGHLRFALPHYRGAIMPKLHAVRVFLRRDNQNLE